MRFSNEEIIHWLNKMKENLGPNLQIIILYGDPNSQFLRQDWSQFLKKSFIFTTWLHKNKQTWPEKNANATCGPIMQFTHCINSATSMPKSHSSIVSMHFLVPPRAVGLVCSWQCEAKQKKTQKDLQTILPLVLTIYSTIIWYTTVMPTSSVASPSATTWHHC